MGDVPAWVQTILAAVGGSIGVYAGIRADLARIQERATHALRSASSAHQRIDALVGGIARSTSGTDDGESGR